MESPLKNLTYLLVSLIVRAYMIGALAVSFTHIIEASHKLGLYGWQAWTVPFAIDGLALLGMVGRSSRFAESTRCTGFKLQIGAGLISLAAKVYAGQTRGEQIYGVLIVAMFVTAEWYAGKLRPAPSARSVAAQKGAATRKVNAATKAPAKAKASKPSTAKRRPAQRPMLVPVPAAAPAA